MTGSDMKAELHHYLRGARETLVWKLDGLSEYDVRRPLTPTGTNLLGLVKHSTTTHLEYFGEVFDRSHDASSTRRDGDVEPNAEFWATPQESRQDVVADYRSAWEFSDASIEARSLDAVGRVPWWGGAAVTLCEVLVHVTAETQRHAGHADIIRELIDGSAGLLDGNDNLRLRDAAEQRRFHDRVEAAAAEFR